MISFRLLSEAFYDDVAAHNRKLKKTWLYSHPYLVN